MAPKFGCPEGMDPWLAYEVCTRVERNGEWGASHEWYIEGVPSLEQLEDQFGQREALGSDEEVVFLGFDKDKMEMVMFQNNIEVRMLFDDYDETRYVVLHADIKRKGFKKKLLEKERAERLKEIRKELDEEFRKKGLEPIRRRRKKSEKMRDTKAKKAPAAAARKKATRPRAVAGTRKKPTKVPAPAARKKPTNAPPPSPPQYDSPAAPPPQFYATPQYDSPAAPPPQFYATPQYDSPADYDGPAATYEDAEIACEHYESDVPPPPDFVAAEAAFPLPPPYAARCVPVVQVFRRILSSMAGEPFGIPPTPPPPAPDPCQPTREASSSHTPPPPATQPSQTPPQSPHPAATAAPWADRSPTPVAYTTSDSSAPDSSPPRPTQRSPTPPACGTQESPPPQHWGYDDPPPVLMSDLGVDWSQLIIDPVPFGEFDKTEVANEDRVYAGLGLKADDEHRGDMLKQKRGEAKADRSPASPVAVVAPELQKEIDDAAMPVDDYDPDAVVVAWDRENPDMSVGVYYPTMPEFRLAVRQHAIVEEFELKTLKTDKKRFSGRCKAHGRPWRIRAFRQPDNTVRVNDLLVFMKCS